MTRKRAVAVGVCGAIGIVAVVLFRAVDGGDVPSGPATDPEPTLWMESEFG